MNNLKSKSIFNVVLLLYSRHINIYDINFNDDVF